MVTVIFSDDREAPEDALEMTLADAMVNLRFFPNAISRIRETATPDADGVGAFVLEVEYDSILVGSTLTFIS